MEGGRADGMPVRSVKQYAIEGFNCAQCSAGIESAPTRDPETERRRPTLQPRHLSRPQRRLRALEVDMHPYNREASDIACSAACSTAFAAFIFASC